VFGGRSVLGDTMGANSVGGAVRGESPEGVVASGDVAGGENASGPERNLVAVRRFDSCANRDDSCAGSKATTLPTTTRPATTAIAKRDIANPTSGPSRRSIRAAKVSARATLRVKSTLRPAVFVKPGKPCRR
jgi:hypothetical protein